MGDGVLIEFASAVDAVECVIQLQEAMESVNAGLPDDRRGCLGLDAANAITAGDSNKRMMAHQLAGGILSK